MSPERYRQVKVLFQAVLDIAPDARAAYLDEACAQDEELRREVESLLESHNDAGEFIEAPALESVTRPESVIDPNSPIGQRIGPYQVMRELGQGGM